MKMNDRYLFKAKDNLHKGWHIGSLVKEPDGMYIREIHRDLMVCIATITICQCAGLKDKNGKVIWENDIVEILSKDGRFVIEWSDTEAKWQMRSFEEEYTVDFDNYWSREVEVIGNKFDNPELLESEE